MRPDGIWKRRGWGLLQAWGWAGVLLLTAGCLSLSPEALRHARYRPSVDDRSPWQGSSPVGAEEGPSNPSSRTMRRGDKVSIFLRDIPRPEEIVDVIDDTGQVNLPLVGMLRLEGLSTSQAEGLIANAYIKGGYYVSINVIVVAQEDEYFVRGEVNRPGRYTLSRDKTLSQAIAEAGGYTDFAKETRVRIIRGEEALTFDLKRIEKRAADDPLIKSGDIIVVTRRIVF